MKRRKTRPVSLSYRAIIAPVFALALAACGVAPDPTMGATGRARMVDHATADTSQLTEEERALRSDPACDQPSPRFEAVILDVLNRYNVTVARSQADGSYRTLSLAGHPDAPRANGGEGVAVLVCADSRMAAYAYVKTVALHEGLLWMIEEAAGAMSLYTDDPAARGRKLDEITHNALEGRFGVSTSGDGFEKLDSETLASETFTETFSSAVAFVIYHELGHTVMGHALRGIDGDVGEPAVYTFEIQADIFAAASMMATGYSMEGVNLVFSILDRVSPGGSSAHLSSRERASLVHRVAQDDRFAFVLEPAPSPSLGASP